MTTKYSIPQTLEVGTILTKAYLSQDQKDWLVANLPQRFVIRISGTAGAGKGTISAKLSTFFSIPFIDTGIIWRAIAYGYQLYPANNSPEHTAFLFAKINLVHENSTFAVFFEGNKLNQADLRNPQIDATVSKYSINRTEYFNFLEGFLNQNEKPLILDGRGSQTIYLQSAEKIGYTVCRLFLTAAVEEVTRRRFEDYVRRQSNTSNEMSTTERDQLLEKIKQNLIMRDHDDFTISNNQNPNWWITPSTGCIDTSDFTIDEVFETTLAFIFDHITKN